MMFYRGAGTCRPNAQSTCSRTRAERWSLRRFRALTTAAEVGAFPKATATCSLTSIRSRCACIALPSVFSLKFVFTPQEAFDQAHFIELVARLVIRL